MSLPEHPLRHLDPTTDTPIIIRVSSLQDWSLMLAEPLHRSFRKDSAEQDLGSQLQCIYKYFLI